jgi:ATP-binding cassette, subfamily A (ABC1), member 3
VSLFRALLVSLNVYSLACEGTARAVYPVGIDRYGGPILYLVIQALLLICFLMFWESGRSLEIFGIRIRRKSSNDTDVEEKTGNIHAEAAEDARHIAHTNEGLRVHNISKTFGRNTAVDNLTFGVLPSEKFALLGPNGAGKSTMISLIRGELHPDSTALRGNIVISNDSLMHAPVAAKHHLGVCPQFDAVDKMTLTENLHFYARARGVPNRQHNIDELVRCLGLQDHVHKLVGKLSGGTKRKLSLAIALISDPSVLLLDEPSSGMDAAAKRALWRTLRDVASDRCLLITTHSMEEADALCDRAGIMASRMLALDTIPKLREKHGGRLYLHLVHRNAPYSTQAETEQLWQWVQSNFHAVQAEQKTFGGQIRFSVPLEGGDGESMGRLFRRIEEAKDNVGIRDYSIGPTTLDQVFMNVVGKHNVAEENAGLQQRKRRWWSWT